MSLSPSWQVSRVRSFIEMEKKNDAKASNGVRNAGYTLLPNGNVELWVKSTFGNHNYTGKTTVPQDAAFVGAAKGFLWEIQRSPAGKAEIAITGFDGKTEATTKPPGWAGRAECIPFDEKSAAILKRELSNRANFAKDSFLPPDAKIVMEVTEHEATAAEPKFRATRNLIQGLVELGLKEEVVKLAKAANYKGGGKLDHNNDPFVEAVGIYRARVVKSL
jgi:hypothetical protein